MKKLNLLAILLLGTVALPSYAGGLATVEQVELAAGIEETKDVSVLREEKATTVALHGAVEVNDVIDSGNKTVTLKMKNGSMWKLAEKTKFKLLNTKENKAGYELLSGTVDYLSGKKMPAAVLKVNGKDYTISASANVSVSYTAEVTELTVDEGSIKMASGVIKKGTVATVDKDGKVTTQDALKKRGIRG